MRVLHVGNTANNGYNNAKLLRRAGVDADLVFDERHVLSQPEWEDGVVEAPVDEYAQLAAASARAGWSRPAWVLPAADPATRRGVRARQRAAYAFRLARRLPSLRALHRQLRVDYEPLREVLGADLTFADVLAGDRLAWVHGLVIGEPGRLFGDYDVVQAYANHALLPLLAGHGRPFVAYEHGTMRELPFEGTPRARLLALAYRRAACVIITNADVLEDAQRLGLERTAFVPHPVDETKYTPGPADARAELGAAEGDLLLVCPARQHWGLKGNDVVLRAFARLVADRPALLVLSEWGEDVERSRGLVRELGLEGRVLWFPPFPKRRLVEVYRAADVVLDQFVLGTFGGIAPEAMACGRPAVLAYDPRLHEWCFPEQPPVVTAWTDDELVEALRRLGDDPEERGRLGAAGRDWFERNHGWRLVADRQRAIYEDVTG